MRATGHHISGAPLAGSSSSQVTISHIDEHRKSGYAQQQSLVQYCESVVRASRIRQNSSMQKARADPRRTGSKPLERQRQLGSEESGYEEEMLVR